jgi:amino acid transporter
MLVVVASYRQNVQAYPSGGGDYEVVTKNLGPNAGSDGRQRAAGRLHPHRRRVDVAASANIASAYPMVRRAPRSADHRDDHHRHVAQPARGP